MDSQDLLIKNLYDLIFQFEKLLEKETKKSVRAYASGRISGLTIALSLAQALQEEKLEKHYSRAFIEKNIKQSTDDYEQ